MGSVVEMILGKDIVLDQEAFQRASQEFDVLSQDLQTLRSDIEKMLTEIAKGFDSPAGKKFIQSCKDHLLQPLDDQKIVLDHVVANLQMCKNEYQTVFDGYRELNAAIQNMAE